MEFEVDIKIEHQDDDDDDADNGSDDILCPLLVSRDPIKTVRFATNIEEIEEGMMIFTSLMIMIAMGYIFCCFSRSLISIFIIDAMILMIILTSLMSAFITMLMMTLTFFVSVLFSMEIDDDNDCLVFSYSYLIFFFQKQ